MASVQRHALVFGGTGQIGAALLRRLLADGWRVTALSRKRQSSTLAIDWRLGDFERMPVLPDAVDAIFSTGPLDHFAQWYARAAIVCPRVIAFGSTSVDTKRDSIDAGEQDLARRLQAAEASIFSTARERAAHATLLRPTLVYGAGRDRSLTRIVEMAQRRGFFVLPSNADGLRQPVHVEDLADAAMAVVDIAATHDRSYALPGGETLSYRDMVARTLRALDPPRPLWTLPAPIFSVVVHAARMFGALHGFSDAAASRMREDLVFDATPARTDFGYAPRAFDPANARR